jgi:hypothetical protein
MFAAEGNGTDECIKDAAGRAGWLFAMSADVS